METNNKLFNWGKKLGLIGIGLCGLCCLSPLIFAFLGISIASWILSIAESIGIVSLLIAIGFLAIWITKRKSHSTCAIDCGCKSKTKL